MSSYKCVARNRRTAYAGKAAAALKEAREADWTYQWPYVHLVISRYRVDNMSDGHANTESLTAADLQKAALHLVTAIHHLQTAIAETLPAIRHAEHGRHPHFGAIENSLSMSRQSVLEAFDILEQEPKRSAT